MRRAAMRLRTRAKTSLLDALHPAQLAFVSDPSKRKAALAGRRGGKTESVAYWLIDGWENYPGETSLFIARTSGHAYSILWEALRRIDARHKLGLRFREDKLTVEFPSRYRIRLGGCDKWQDAEKYRGPRYRRVAIDEAGSFPPRLLQYLVDDVIDPALMDLDGELALTGTPPPIPAGFFYQRTTGDGGTQWSTHQWTCLDNPHVQGEQYLARKLEENGWTVEHPTYIREYLGEWVKDVGALVYPYDGLLNAFTELPDGDLTWALAVDLGAGDSPTTSFALGCTHRGFPDIYVTEVKKHSRMIPSRLAAEVERYRSQHRLSAIVVDEGALGKGYADELRERYGIPVEPAQKKKKRAYQETLAGDLKSGVVHVDPVKCADWIDEVIVLQWNDARTAEADGQANHAADSVLYLSRALRPHYRPELEPPNPGSSEWWEQERVRLRKAAEQRVKERQSGRRRFGGGA
jgi:hypothetical protein